jgi:hypothetical protein
MKASHGEALVRWREQAAQMIVRSGACWNVMTGPIHGIHDRTVTAVLDGSIRFDVERVRTKCEKLIAESKAAEETWVVYTDWLRACGWHEGLVAETYQRMFQHLPTRSKAERLARTAILRAGVGLLGRCFGPEHEALRDLWAAGPGQGKRPVMPADAIATARTARRLLATLEGRCPWARLASAQSSRCKTCHGEGEFFSTAAPRDEHGIMGMAKCPECRTTGHNLAGFLPPLEHTPALLRHARDIQDRARPGRGLPRWMLALGVTTADATRWKGETRVGMRRGASEELPDDQRVAERERHRDLLAHRSMEGHTTRQIEGEIRHLRIQVERAHHRIQRGAEDEWWQRIRATVDPILAGTERPRRESDPATVILPGQIRPISVSATFEIE